jgi:hypothetical protein
MTTYINKPIKFTFAELEVIKKALDLLATKSKEDFTMDPPFEDYIIIQTTIPKIRQKIDNSIEMGSTFISGKTK